jgi:nucleotide-binding universal stress UspA family protein
MTHPTMAPATHPRRTTLGSGTTDADSDVAPSRAIATGPIVLGTEFSAVSSAAEQIAIEHAARSRVPLIIVHAIDPGRLRLPGGRFRLRFDQARDARGADATAIEARVRAAGVVPQVLIWSGDPATCVLDAARAEGASRIVVGTHGRGRLGRAIAGSVSADIAAAAPCPVDIVRADGSAVDIVTVAPRANAS